MVHLSRLFLSRFTVHGSRPFAYFAQVAEAVDARAVAVAPAEGERVAPDDLNVFDGETVGYRFGPQDALARELVDALRARTQTPQSRRGVAAHATVRPSDAQQRVRLLHDLARLARGPAPRRFGHK